MNNKRTFLAATATLLLLLVLVAGIFIESVECHSRWKFPAPRNSDSGIKDYPCGALAFFGLGQPVTTLVGGQTYNLTFEEQINHDGSPIRIALSYDDDTKYDKLVLLDHIPHNNLGTASISVPRPYRIQVTIPNIDW